MIKISRFPGPALFCKFQMIGPGLASGDVPSSHLFSSLSSNHPQLCFASPIHLQSTNFKTIGEKHVVKDQRCVYKECACRTFRILPGYRRQRIRLLLRYPDSVPMFIHSGQIPADATGALIDGDIKAHTVIPTRQLLNIRNNVSQI